MLGTIFNEILYRPIFNILVFLYNIIPGHDFGIAIILLTIVVRVVLFPVAYKSIKSRLALSALQPKIKEIQNKYKNKEEQSRELMKVYKEHNVNPFSGCFALVIQLVVLIQLYRVFINVLKAVSLSALYPFIKSPGAINPSFLGIMDLSATSINDITKKIIIINFVVVILAAIAQFFSSKITTKLTPVIPQPGADKKANNFQKIMGQQMIYLAPILTIFIGIRFPAGLALYWLVNSILGIGQDYYLLNKFYGKSKANNQGHSPKNGDR